MKRAIVLLIAFSFWALPLSAASQTEAKPQPNTETKSEQVTTPDNESSANNQSNKKGVGNVSEIPNAVKIERETKKPGTSKAVIPSIKRSQTGHPTRAEKQISGEVLRLWLQQRGSPLWEYSDQLVQSPYWSTIIGICTIEQYGCTRAPGNNYWGIMCGNGVLCRYTTLTDGIAAIDKLLAKYDAQGRNTVEELNCYYVSPCSSNWLNTVIKTKTQLESIE